MNWAVPPFPPGWTPGPEAPRAARAGHLLPPTNGFQERLSCHSSIHPITAQKITPQPTWLELIPSEEQALPLRLGHSEAEGRRREAGWGTQVTREMVTGPEPVAEKVKPSQTRDRRTPWVCKLTESRILPSGATGYKSGKNRGHSVLFNQLC